jgi:hypothetical protein
MSWSLPSVNALSSVNSGDVFQPKNNAGLIGKYSGDGTSWNGCDKVNYTLKVGKDQKYVDGDLYYLNMDFNFIKGRSNPGSFIFTQNVASDNQNQPPFYEQNHAKPNTQNVTNRFVIKDDSEHYFDVENGTILLNNMDTGLSSQLVRKGDVVQISSLANSGLNSESYVSFSYKDLNDNIKITTREHEYDDLKNKIYSPNANVKYYLIKPSKDGKLFNYSIRPFQDFQMRVLDVDSGNYVTSIRYDGSVYYWNDCGQTSECVDYSVVNMLVEFNFDNLAPDTEIKISDLSY